jgi:hypothetical protein
MPIEDKISLVWNDRDDFSDRESNNTPKVQDFIDDNSSLVLGLRGMYTLILPYLKSKIQEFKNIMSFSKQGYLNLLGKP